MRVSFRPHAFTPSELAEQLAADRRGSPYVLLRDGQGRQHVVELTADRMTVGREAGADIILHWDGEVSRVHAQLERVGGQWTIVDDGLSRNGTFVGDTRVVGRRRLSDGEIMRFGRTEVLLRDPGRVPAETAHAAESAAMAGLTPGQKRILVALCRPLAVASVGTTPSSNREIAEDLHLSVEAVRTQLKALFRSFEVPDLPQNRKRAELARRALASGVVTRADLEG